MSNRVIALVKEHPAGAGIAAVVAIILLMFMFKGGSGGGSNSSGMAAYYNAMSAQTAAGNAVQMEKLQLDHATNDETIASQYGLAAAQIKSGDTRYQIDSNERLGIATLNEQQFQTETQHAIADNLVNLQNSTLHSNEIVAQIQGNTAVNQAKASKPSWFQTLVGGISSVASSVLPFVL